MSRVIHILNGPNLGRLGKRQPEVYGATTYDDLVQSLHEHADRLGCQITVQQTDSEAELIGWVHDSADSGDPVIINAGGLTHTSVALRDACAELCDSAGYVEVHISNIHAREDFRHHSYLSENARGVIVGLGTDVYHLALEWWASQQ